jgi:hypothetical protein
MLLRCRNAPLSGIGAARIRARFESVKTPASVHGAENHGADGAEVGEV